MLNTQQIKIKAKLLGKRLSTINKYQLLEKRVLYNNVYKFEIGDWLYLSKDNMVVERSYGGIPSTYRKPTIFAFTDVVKIIYEAKTN